MTDPVIHDDMCEANDGPVWAGDWPCACEDRVVIPRWHRGERVQHRDGRRGVVEGWKGRRVVVLWGVFDSRPIREWVDATLLRLSSEKVVDL